MTNTNHSASSFVLYPYVGMLFVASLLISNVAAQKLFAFGPFTFTCGILVFPITYIFGDVLTEVYGYVHARRVIWTGFFCSILMVAIIEISVALPPAAGWPHQQAFETALSNIPRIVLASLVAYLCGEFINSFTLARLKVLTAKKHLWIRTISSTITGQAVDTSLFVLIAFAGTIPSHILLQAAVSGYLFKVLYEAAATPLTYIVVSFLKRTEQIDAVDEHTDFNPFSLKT